MLDTAGVLLTKRTGIAAAQDCDPIIAVLWQRHFRGAGLEAGTHLLQRSFGAKRLLRFIADLNSATGIEVPPTAVMRLGTAKALSDVLHSADWPAAGPCIALRYGTDEEQLFIVSAGSGLVLELCDLAALIDFSGRIWGLQLPGLDGEQTALRDIRDVARRHAKEILSLAGNGRCHIVGYSFGGLVAVEVARELRQTGTAVGLVGLIDTTCYEAFWPKTEWLRVTGRRLGRRVRHLGTLSGPEARRFLADRISAAIHHLRRRLTPGDTANHPQRSIYYIGGLDPRFQRVRDASIAAWESFKPSRFAGELVLFRSSSGDPHACDPAAIWRRVTATLRVVTIPGSHTTILRKPLVRVLADAISISLAERRGPEAGDQLSLNVPTSDRRPRTWPARA